MKYTYKSMYIYLDNQKNYLKSINTFELFIIQKKYVGVAEFLQNFFLSFLKCQHFTILWKKNTFGNFNLLYR